MDSKAKEKLASLLNNYFNVGDSYYYELTRVKEAFDVGTMTFDDFHEFDEDTIDDLVEYICEKIDDGEI